MDLKLDHCIWSCGSCCIIKFSTVFPIAKEITESIKELVFIYRKCSVLHWQGDWLMEVWFSTEIDLPLAVSSWTLSWLFPRAQTGSGSPPWWGSSETGTHRQPTATRDTITNIKTRLHTITTKTIFSLLAKNCHFVMTHKCNLWLSYYF